VAAARPVVAHVLVAADLTLGAIVKDGVGLELGVAPAPGDGPPQPVNATVVAMLPQPRRTWFLRCIRLLLENVP
jgi:hypothetical protein